MRAPLRVLLLRRQALGLARGRGALRCTVHQLAVRLRQLVDDGAEQAGEQRPHTLPACSRNLCMRQHSGAKWLLIRLQAARASMPITSLHAMRVHARTSKYGKLCAAAHVQPSASLTRRPGRSTLVAATHTHWRQVRAA